MAYNLFAVIGRIDDVTAIDHPQLLGPVALADGFALRPLDVAWLEEESDVHPRQLDDVETLLGDAVTSAPNGRPVAYVAIETFGGSLETNGAIAWSGGGVLYRELVDEAGAAGRTVLPADEAFAIMGVVPTGGRDSFDTLGLGRYRSTEEWR